MIDSFSLIEGFSFRRLVSRIPIYAWVSWHRRQQLDCKIEIRREQNLQKLACTLTASCTPHRR